MDHKILSSMAMEFHLFQRFLLGLENEFQTWTCLQIFWAHIIGPSELKTTVGSSHRTGNLEATLFTCLSRQSAHSIEIFYDIIHHHLKIRAHVQHKLTLDYVKNARVHAQEAVLEAQGLLGEWEIRDNIHLNGRRVRVDE